MNPMNVMLPPPIRPGCARTTSADQGPAAAAMADDHTDEDLMTRRQVASLFRVTSAAVAAWARRGRLPEVRNEAGRPRYRRADVEELFQTAVRRGAQ
jgi:Helix-turn-helix domain